jgi:adenine-specific DNA-methyltransferase
MEIPQKKENCSLLDYSVELSDCVRRIHSVDQRKEKGQFFTNKKVASFMASLLDLEHDELKLLDPGAGTGILSAAICDRIVLESKNKFKLTIDCYEQDSCVVPYLKCLMTECKNIFENHGHKMDFNIYESNFILDNADYDKKCEKKKYDLAVSNPPYYKLRKDSAESLAVDYLKLDSPNIYPLFMLFVAKMLKKNGEMVFIVPRSFCSGLYYKKIRKWLLKNLYFENIHLFQSRRDIFDNNEVLQENIIFKAIKKLPEERGTIVSSSYNKDFDNFFKIEAMFTDIVFSKNGDNYIRIPTSENDLKIIHIVDSWEYTLEDFGMTVSTGKVVDFRTKENLRDDHSEKDCVPLLWMQNLEKNGINLTPKHLNKKSGINVNKNTYKILVPVKNYILLKRLTSKCCRKRVCAVPFLKKDFKDFKFIGFENHLNYISGINRDLDVNEINCLCAFLTSDIFDEYFRIINGSTQVNASDLRKIPLPKYDLMYKIANIQNLDEVQNIV